MSPHDSRIRSGDVPSCPFVGPASGVASEAHRACRQARARLHQLATRPQTYPSRRGSRCDRPRPENAMQDRPIAVTGDLVNLSLPTEYALARTWLETARASARRHGHSRQSRRLRRGRRSAAARVLERLHAGRRRRAERHVPVPAAARASH